MSAAMAYSSRSTCARPTKAATSTSSKARRAWPTPRSTDGIATEQLQTRAQGLQAADRPLVEPLVQLQRRGDRGRGLPLDPARQRAFAGGPRKPARPAPGRRALPG